MKFGVREICDVVLKAKATQKIGNKVFYKHEPVIYFDTLKTSTLEGAATTVYAQGGRGNPRLIAWEGERTIIFTMEDALISPEGFAILSGAGIIEASNDKPIYQHVTEISNKITSGIDYVDVILENKPALLDSNEEYVYMMAMKDGNVISEPYLGREVENSIYDQAQGLFVYENALYKIDGSIEDMEDGTKTLVSEVPNSTTIIDGVIGFKITGINDWPEGAYIEFSESKEENESEKYEYRLTWHKYSVTAGNVMAWNSYYRLNSDDSWIPIAEENRSETILLTEIINNNNGDDKVTLPITIINYSPCLNSDFKDSSYSEARINIIRSSLNPIGNDTKIGNLIRIPAITADNKYQADLDILASADAVLVDYYIERTSKAKQIEITADKFGGNFYLEASTLFRNEAGVDMPAEFVIPNCNIQSNFNFSMASSGDPSTFTFTMDAFPDYTRFDSKKKVLFALQIIESGADDELKEYGNARTSTVATISSSAAAEINEPAAASLEEEDIDLLEDYLTDEEI